MPGIARKDGTDTVSSKTGGPGSGCNTPVIAGTGVGSSTVFVNGKGVIRIGDVVGPHKFTGCGPDTSVLTSASPNIFVDGARVARDGDQYTSDNTITSGSPNVIAN